MEAPLLPPVLFSSHQSPTLRCQPPCLPSTTPTPTQPTQLLVCLLSLANRNHIHSPPPRCHCWCHHLRYLPSPPAHLRRLWPQSILSQPHFIFPSHHQYQLEHHHKKPNKKLVYIYNPVTISVTTDKDGILIGNGLLPSFVHGTKNTTFLKASITSSGQQLDDTSSSELKTDLKSNNGLGLKIELETKVKVKMGGLKHRRLGLEFPVKGLKLRFLVGKRQLQLQYLKLNARLLFDAHKVFNSAPFEGVSNLLLWNSILRANVSNENYENALKLYVRMRRAGAFGDGFTFPLVLRACAYMGNPIFCKIVHGHALEMGFQNHLHVGNELMGMYAKVGQMGDAHNVFDRMGVRSYISWNTMVSGYAFNYDCNGALEIFKRMQSEGLEPNLVTWTSLMSSHARSGWLKETMELFDLIRMRGIEVSAEALAVVLSVCADLGVFYRGTVIHGFVIKGGFEDYSFVKNALLCVYGKHGDVNSANNLFLEMKNKSIASWNALITSHLDAGLCDEALEIFSQLERSEDCPTLRPNVVSWSAVIDGFASHGRGGEALDLFRRMQFAKVLANAVTISTILSVCAELPALHLGYGMHGLGVKALETFDQMIKLAFKPDGVTFVAIISACSHAGLVPEGRRLFDLMLREYRIEPQMEHYACMVDLLGRAGLLQEASEIVKNMPLEPNACVWGALLNSCRMHNNTKVAGETASHIFSLNRRETTGNYMLLSNIYAASGRWKDSATVRTSARAKGLRKYPGQSWIKVKKNVYIFSAGNNTQKGLEKVSGILEALTLQMESEEYVHSNSIIPQDVDEVARLTMWG
ncbi:hypothetical protein GH714_019517 [Hevea brasiliensis]|uniref:Pentatricopeptide repeat-containing protein n=1 Tax=Hevea brasiliensis TaxID=3981 RepID=A0A6A6LI09_HEVBR|nr:hypothetical protein GH714_019517 [Hevea brasiliensis]